MAHITLDNVSKSFASDRILSNINCQFHSNKITAIIGKSGSGKSTLLKLINGLEQPTLGTVSVFNTQLCNTNAEQLRKKMGYSVQGTGLFPHLTIQQNICLLADLESWPKEKIAHRLQELIQLVELDETLLIRYPYELSGGQQQRAGLCRAMMLNPEVLLFDEAFAAVDPITRNEIHTKILELQAAKPNTLIMVTHDLQEAFRLADYIMVIANQQIVSYQAKEAYLSQSMHQSSAFEHYNFSPSLLQWLS